MFEPMENAEWQSIKLSVMYRVLGGHFYRQAIRQSRAFGLGRF